MSDSGRQIGDCKHGKYRPHCFDCQAELLAAAEARVKELEADNNKLKGELVSELCVGAKQERIDLRARVKLLEGQRQRLSKLVQYLSSDCEDGPGTKRCETCVGCRVCSALADVEANP